MLPRNGFLHESRSSPIIGPPKGHQLSPRFDPQQYQVGSGPDLFYDAPPLEKYRPMPSACVTRLGPGLGKKVGPRIDPAPYKPGAGAQTFYEIPEVRSGTAPSLGPGYGRPSVPRDCDLVPPGCGADQIYTLPDPESYKQQSVHGVPRWDPKRPRFEKEWRPPCDQMYSLPDESVYMSIGANPAPRLGPGLGKKVGDRIDPAQYRVGQGADALYSLPELGVYRASKSSSSCRFGGARVRPEKNPFPVRMPSEKQPPWVARVASYKPLPRHPWLR
jgi:hypothetical protein